MNNFSIHIACAANKIYLPHAAAMLTSLLENNPKPSITIHFLHDNSIPEKDIGRLREHVQSYGKEFLTYNPEKEVPRNVPLPVKFSIAAWFRVLLPDLLKEIDRVLYLDADLIVTNSIEKLWGIELGDKMIGAVQNPLYRLMSEAPILALGLEDLRYYFNSGVLLMDLSALRRFSLSTKVFTIAAKRPEITRYADQEPLNAILNGHVMLLHPRWNMQNIFFHLSRNQLLKQGTPREWLTALPDSSVIVHFSGPWKPWDARCDHPLREKYWHYLTLSPFREIRRPQASLRDKVLRKLGAHTSILALELLRLLRGHAYALRFFCHRHSNVRPTDK